MPSSSANFKDREQLRTYDYVVANPPFSDKTWGTGLTPSADPFKRFEWGEPPAKQGDYAYLLHIIRLLNNAGKGACILPHASCFAALSLVHSAPPPVRTTRRHPNISGTKQFEEAI